MYSVSSNSAIISCVVQCAYIVWSVVNINLAVLSILVPFVSSVYHPLNVYPLLVGVGNSPYVLSYFICLLVGVTVPPVALYFNVYSLASHFAYKSSLLFDV